MAGRVSQESVEAEVVGTPTARVSQVVVEAPVTAASAARVSQIVVEAPVTLAGAARVSQIVAEAISAFGGGARISQIIVECLVVNLEIEMPPIYPKLPGLAFSQFWNSEFFNIDTQKSSTGAEFDLGLADAPLHDFELTYEFLRDRFGFMEQKTLRGFFFVMQGVRGRCLYKNEDDYTVSRQIIGTTDGSSHLWQLVRTYGAGEYSGTEPIGYVDLTAPFRLYLDGALQDTASYSVLTTEPVNQQVEFAGVPGAGKVITVDMNYFYYCKLSGNAMTFEKFMHQLWSVGKVTLHSCRTGA